MRLERSVEVCRCQGLDVVLCRLLHFYNQLCTVVHRHVHHFFVLVHIEEDLILVYHELVQFIWL